MTNVFLKSFKIIKIPSKPKKKRPNMIKNLENDQNTPKTYKMTKIPLKPKMEETPVL